MAVLLSIQIDLFYFMARGKKGPQSDYTKLVLKKLGARIKELRIASGEQNYEKFAFKHDLNRAQISRYENGEDMYFSSLLKVLKALDISLGEFFKDSFDDL